jgi:hypothetical protein
MHRCQPDLPDSMFYGAVDLFESKEFEILADGLRRFAAPERMNDRIQRDSRAHNVAVAVPHSDVLLYHLSFDCTASTDMHAAVLFIDERAGWRSQESDFPTQSRSRSDVVSHWHSLLKS